MQHLQLQMVFGVQRCFIARAHCFFGDVPPLLRGRVGVVPNISAFAMHQKQAQLRVLIAVKPRLGCGRPQLFYLFSVIADAGAAFDIGIQIGAVFAESHAQFGIASLHTGHNSPSARTKKYN